MKPRILMVNESSVLNTGYSVYGREVLSRLHASGKYEVAELATYVDRYDERLQQVPWRVYPNYPDHYKNLDDNSEVKRNFDSKLTNVFGEYTFENICLDFKPHIVFAIRDFWMDEFLDRNPYRRLFNLALLAPVDSEPQNEQWLALYGSADAVFSYTDWGIDTLKRQTNNSMNIKCAVPAIAAPEFFPIEEKTRLKIKNDIGLGNYKIIGTVMRNQRRKLFPELFQAFRKFLDVTKRNDVLLYCHTSYPDVGWDIPKLLLEYGLSSKVLFSYVCSECNHYTSSFFSGAVSACIKCNSVSIVAGVEKGLDNQALNIVYNMMDLYVQCANSEGQGLPQVEASAAGVPVASVDYSGMEDVVRKVFGYPIPVLHKNLEPETGTYRVTPNVEYLANFFTQFFAENQDWHTRARKVSRAGFEQNYTNWDKTADKWMQYFDTVDIEKYEKLWNSPPELREPKQPIEGLAGMSNGEFVEWAIKNVLCDPSKVGSYMHTRMLRDLNIGVTFGGTAGLYFNESSYEHGKPKQPVKFDREILYNHLAGLAYLYNESEGKRG